MLSVPIGRPADHVRLSVLTDGLSPVPEGVPGELCISRFGLAAGYHRREDATALRFVADPFHAGDRMYRTGDLVRFVDPCTLEYLGRIDRQMKIAGYRVEADEIEGRSADARSRTGMRGHQPPSRGGRRRWSHPRSSTANAAGFHRMSLA